MRDLPAFDALGAALRRAAVRSTYFAPCCGRPAAYCYCAEDRARYERKQRMRFRKKPVEIEAVEWTGRNQQEIHDFTTGTAKFQGSPEDGWTLVIPTLEGDHRAGLGDWIIRGVQGEFYPCKAEIFEATYEALDAL